jgi:lantibiotic modifying enzyme
VSALLPALDIPSLRPKALKLIVKGCDWLLNHELVEDSSVSKFPSVAGCQHPSRLGWCYGDLTIALTLARVGKKLDDDRYLSLAEKLAKHSANRKVENAMVDDAGICHGTAGLFLIFHQLNNLIPCSSLQMAAYRWLQEVLEQFELNGKSAFFEYSIPHRCHIESSGLLTGYSGIGLCLLAALGQDTEWSDCLLLN